MQPRRFIQPSFATHIYGSDSSGKKRTKCPTAEVSLDLSGRDVRAKVAAPTMHEAVDLVGDRAGAMRLQRREQRDDRVLP